MFSSARQGLLQFFKVRAEENKRQGKTGELYIRLDQIGIIPVQDLIQKTVSALALALELQNCEASNVSSEASAFS